MFKPFDIVHEDFFGLRANESAFGLQSILNAAFTPDFVQDFDTALSFPGEIDDINLSFGCACEKHVQGHDHAHDSDGHFDIYPHYHGPDGVALADGREDNADGTPSVFMEGDVPEDTTTTAVVTVDTAYVGVLEVDFDNDWIRFEVVEGQRYQINVDGTGTMDLEDPLVNIRDQNGTFLASNDDANGTRNSEISFSADYTGVYYIDVSHWENDNGAQPELGEYTVTAQEVEALSEFTNDQIADYLTDGSWTRRTHDDDDNDASNGTTITYHIDDLPVASQALALAAMQAWADVANLNFVEVAVAAGADLRFEDGEDGAYARTTTAGVGNISSVVINVSQADWIDTYGTDINSYSYQTYIHEIGHALGLGHGGPYNGSAVYNFNNIYTNDSWATTVMSYFDQNEAGSGTARLVLGTQVADIIAIQNLYGENTTTRSGDSVYGFNSTEAGSIYDSQAWMDQGIRLPSFSIWDAAGTDTLDFSGYVSNQTISLIEETFSSVGDNTNTTADITDALQNVISVARGAVIENAIGGTGADTITGNAVSNVITGNAGNDILDGGDGIDYAVFNVAAFTDLTIVENADGTFTITANTGTDGTDTLSNIEFIRIGNEDFALGAEVDETINGTANNDILFGTAEDDVINGLAGDDRLRGLEGDDLLDGGAGNDNIDAASGNDVITGGAGDDEINGGTGTDYAVYNVTDVTDLTVVQNSDGTYTVTDNTGVEGVDTLRNVEFIRVGNQDFDIASLVTDETINGTANNDILFGTAEDDVINGLAGDDRLRGLEGDDLLDGGAGNDNIDAASGNDVITGGAGDDEINGGTGTDYAVYNVTDVTDLTVVQNSDGTYTVTDNTGVEGVDTLRNVEFIRVGNQDFDITSLVDDSINGSENSETLQGTSGDDIINALGGNDTLVGGFGNDILNGGAGGDVLDGGEGQDMASYETSTNRVVINMLTDSITSGHATSDTFISIEDIRGTAFGDTLTGDAGDNVFYGDGGFDILSGFSGNDTIYGGAGDDFITGGAGADMIDGGDGNDIARYVGSQAGVNVNLETGLTSGGDAQGDVLTNVERLFGSNHDDTFTGDAQNNWLFGDGGNDTLDGGAGIDKFFGGAGSDTFVFSAGDQFVYVADFQDDVDNLDFSSYGFDTVADALANMNQFGAHVRFFVDGDTMLILNTTLDAVSDDIVIDNGMV